MSEPQKDQIAKVYEDIQTHICSEIEKTDGRGIFAKDRWKREGGGGGLTRILEGGEVLEKAGVNFSSVEGDLSPEMQKNLNLDSDQFFATGVSIVMHPFSPKIPIIHMNIRYFELGDGTYWFGGGIDLTPHYVVPEEAEYFHREVKAVCDRFHPEAYNKYKKWADDYFYIPHRSETRGVGGIFYDHISAGQEYSKSDILTFSLEIGKLFPKVYGSLINANRDKSYSATEKEWQLIRRGRYVEFNLVYDRGTKFGLFSNGRTESILMSLPKDARWMYNHHPESGSKEAETLSFLRKGINWV
jgi:coproporphyrinogen III oxidase